MLSEKGPDSNNKKSVAANSLYNIAHTVVKLLFPLLTSMYVARILSVEGIGKVATANNLVSYFTAFAALGIPVYGIREIAKLSGKPQEKSRLFSELLIINGCSTVGCIVVFLGVVSLVDIYAAELPLYLCTGLAVLFNFINIDWLYKGNEEYRYITIRSLIIKIICLIALFIFVRKPGDYVVYALLTVLGNGINYIANIINARKFVRFSFAGVQLVRHLKPIGYLFLGTFFSTIYNKLDVTMLSIISGEAATAYYTYAFRIMEMVLMACAAISEVFLPRLSYCYQHERESFRKILETGLNVLMFLSFPMAMGLSLLAPQIILLLYGENFLPAASALRIMAWLVVVKSIGDLLCYQLAICTGNEKRRIPAYAMAAVSNIILNALLIPKMAHSGAVIATVVSELIVNGVVLQSMRKIVDIPVSIRTLVISLGAAAVMGAAVYLVGFITQLPLMLHIVLEVAVGVVVYFGINIALKNPAIWPLFEKARHLLRK